MKTVAAFENLNLAKPFLRLLSNHSIYYELEDHIDPSNPYLPEGPDLEKTLKVLVNEEDWEPATALWNQYQTQDRNPTEREDVFKRNYQAITGSLAVAILLLIIVLYMLNKAKEELAYYKVESLVEHRGRRGDCDEYYWKATDKKSSLSCDYNHDGHYEYYRMFNHDGATLGDFYDGNQNGINEQVKLYSLYGNLSAEYSDLDEDGFEDIMILYTDSLTIRYEDKNHDRIFVENEIVSKERISK